MAGDAAAACERLWETHPPVNPLVVSQLRRARAVIYGAGSLYTSICPSLVVRGVGEEIAALGDATPKIMMLNGSPDRETHGMRASDHVRAVVNALNREHELRHPPRAYVTCLFYPRGAEAHIQLDTPALAAMGVRAVPVPATLDEWGRARYEPQGLVDALLEELETPPRLREERDVERVAE